MFYDEEDAWNDDFDCPEEDVENWLDDIYDDD